jgi:hypothetical protein
MASDCNGVVTVARKHSGKESFLGMSGAIEEIFLKSLWMRILGVTWYFVTASLPLRLDRVKFAA